MARRRGRGGRFISGARRVGRSIRRRARRTLSLGRGAQSHGVMGALQRPVSRMIAPAMGIGALLYLVTPSLPNGDSWIGRLQGGYANYQSSKNPFDLIAQDTDGNNAMSVLAAQIQQNAIGAAFLGLGAGIVGYLGRKAGV